MFKGYDDIIRNHFFCFGKSPPKLAPRFPLLPLPLFSNKAVISLRFQKGGGKKKFQSGEITFPPPPPPPPTFSPLLLGIEQGKGGTELNFMLFLLQYGPMPFSPPPSYSPGGGETFFSLRENERCGWAGGGFEKEEGAGKVVTRLREKFGGFLFSFFVRSENFFRRSYMTRTSLFCHWKRVGKCIKYEALLMQLSFAVGKAHWEEWGEAFALKGIFVIIVLHIGWESRVSFSAAFFKRSLSLCRLAFFFFMLWSTHVSRKKKPRTHCGKKCLAILQSQKKKKRKTLTPVSQIFLLFSEVPPSKVVKIPRKFSCWRTSNSLLLKKEERRQKYFKVRRKGRTIWRPTYCANKENSGRRSTHISRTAG